MNKIIEINENNFSEYPQIICFINPKHEHYGLKLDWLKARFKEGLKIKLLQSTEDQKITGFIEYIPGEKAWRAVNAKNYLFIHCIWVYPNKNKNQGAGSLLIEEVIKDAKTNNLSGVAVISSDRSFMAKKEIFIKNDFEILEEKNGFQLLINKFDNSKEIPNLIDTDLVLKGYQGWNIVYSKQCPWVARFIEEVKPIIKQLGIEVVFVELKTSKEAQEAPSIYSVFSLIKDGKLLADRYISTTRFINIVKQN